MKTVPKVLLIVVLLLALMVPMVGAQEQNIVEIAVADGRFNTLIAAATAAGLADDLQSGEWTAFAPTDAAFAKLGVTADNVTTLFTPEELQNILLYHVLPEAVSLDKAKTMLGDVTMANGAVAGLKYFDDSLWVNDDSRVIIPNILAANGIIHVVDNVILPPWPRVDDQEPSLIPGMTVSGNTIVDIASRDGRFTTLTAAVVAAGLDSALSGGQWTVFAPTDAAFAKLGIDASNVATTFSKDELTDILLYHTLDSSVSSAEAKTMLGNITMANGQLAGLKYFDGSLWVNDDSRVIVADVLADNGYIHAVDTVIMGPWPK